MADARIWLEVHMLMRWTIEEYIVAIGWWGREGSEMTLSISLLQVSVQRWLNVLERKSPLSPSSRELGIYSITHYELKQRPDRPSGRTWVTLCGIIERQQSQVKGRTTTTVAESVWRGYGMDDDDDGPGFMPSVSGGVLGSHSHRLPSAVILWDWEL